MKKSLFHWMIIVSSIWLLVLLMPALILAQNGLKVNTIVICKEVVDHMPLESDNQFDEGVGKLFCFTGVANPNQATNITHVWKYNGIEKASIQVNVGTSSNWRTWTSKMIAPEWTGSWTVSVVDETGKEIATTGFTIEAAITAPPPPPEVEEPIIDSEPAPADEPEEAAVPEIQESEPPVESLEEVEAPPAPPEVETDPAPAPAEESPMPAEETEPDSGM